MTPVRYAAEECLRGIRGAFLRCDRGDRLYVTNAQIKMREAIDWRKAGFHAENVGNLTFLTPDKGWIGRFAEWIGQEVREKRFSDTVRNACFGETDEEDMKLWIDGMKRLEMKGDAAGYEKLVRQRAAVCLRERRGGGTLPACALIVDLMNEGGFEDED